MTISKDNRIKQEQIIIHEAHRLIELIAVKDREAGLKKEFDQGLKKVAEALKKLGYFKAPSPKKKPKT